MPGRCGTAARRSLDMLMTWSCAATPGSRPSRSRRGWPGGWSREGWRSMKPKPGSSPFLRGSISSDSISACDTRSLNASGLTDWRVGICRWCSSGQVLMPIPTLTCVAASWAAGCEAQGRSLSSSRSIRGLRVRGSAGRVNKREPSLMLRHEYPREMDEGPGYRAGPQESGKRRPGSGSRS
jgi:hypothetical protein